jgi:DNA-binding HxlR family transcriptional regulator
MRTPHTKMPRSGCPINIALEALGDSWSLLIVRDLMFKGLKTYKEFMQAGEGIASNILADRLQRLERLGIISKHRDPIDIRRHVYRLTEAGIALAPLQVELILWSARHFRTSAPPEAIHEMQHHRTRFLKRVRRNWENSAPPPG